jgi:hypothetical protein
MQEDVLAGVTHEIPSLGTHKHHGLEFPKIPIQAILRNLTFPTHQSYGMLSCPTPSTV